MKKITSLFLALCMLTCCGVTAFAGSATPIVNDTSNNILTLPDPTIAPFGWPGTGAAPQITKIEYANSGWLEVNGNWGILLKVTGYGSDWKDAFFNGKMVESTRQNYFINSGTTADGWYYLYDCGPITEPGTYQFNTTFTSTNAPYSQRTYTESFTFAYQ